LSVVWSRYETSSAMPALSLSPRPPPLSSSRTFPRVSPCPKQKISASVSFFRFSNSKVSSPSFFFFSIFPYPPSFPCGHFCIFFDGGFWVGWFSPMPLRRLKSPWVFPWFFRSFLGQRMAGLRFTFPPPFASPLLPTSAFPSHWAPTVTSSPFSPPPFWLFFPPTILRFTIFFFSFPRFFSTPPRGL